AGGRGARPRNLVRCKERRSDREAAARSVVLVARERRVGAKHGPRSDRTKLPRKRVLRWRRRRRRSHRLRNRRDRRLRTRRILRVRDRRNEKNRSEDEGTHGYTFAPARLGARLARKDVRV